MIERNVQPGVLLALRGPSQYKRQLGEDTSAAICTAVHEIGVGTHVEGQRLPENGESDGLMIVVDIETVDSAGLIIKTAPTENFVLVKVPSSPIHPKIPINAITTKDINEFWHWRLKFAKSAEAENFESGALKSLRTRAAGYRTKKK